MALVLGVFVCRGTAAYAQKFDFTSRSPRVLLVYPYDERLPSTSIAGATITKGLLEATNGRIDLFSEFLDLARFPEPTHVERMTRYLSEKYADRQPDVMIALGDTSLKFIEANRSRIAPDALVIHGGIDVNILKRIPIQPDTVGAVTRIQILNTLAMARGLQPNARRLAVIAGSAPIDKAMIAMARQELAVASSGYEILFLDGLSMDETIARAKQLGPDTIAIFLTFFSDKDGRNFIPRDAAGLIANEAGAPLYGPYDTYVGTGVVGGNTTTFESMAEVVVELVLRALSNEPIADVFVPFTYLADARQLKRWRLSESDLPQGTRILFQERSLWEEHQAAIIAAILFILLQSAIIAALLLERRRRVRAQEESRRRLMELVHLNQSGTVSALSASIAHELSQPLGAIRSNAEAAEIMLRSEAPDLHLIQQILADIRDDDQRAGEIISRIRSLLRKRLEVEVQEFDLNDAVDAAHRILHAEAERRSIALMSTKAEEPLPIKADRIHLQQVIVNLATNAMEALAEVSLGKRIVLLARLHEADGHAEVSVADSGRGIPAQQLTRIFEPFVTTKPTGTGLGLSISRSIVESYGGRIWAENGPGGGAVFRFVLPIARSRADTGI